MLHGLHNSNLLGFGAQLNSPFRSLGPSILNKGQGMPMPQEPQLPGLWDLVSQLFPGRELGALAKSYYPEAL